MSTVVLRANILEIKLRFSLLLLLLSNLHSNHLQMTKCYPHSKEGQYTY